MLLTILNFTPKPISGFMNPEAKFSAKFSRKKATPTRDPSPEPSAKFDLQPNVLFSTTLPKGWRKEITLLSDASAATSNVDGGVAEAPAGENAVGRQNIKVPISITGKPSWKVVDGTADTPWTMVLSRAEKSQSKLMVFQKREMASFLSQLPDRLPLSSLLLPGTHDTMAFFGWPISQCQTVPLSNQLRDGIRVIDIRLAVVPTPARDAAIPSVLPAGQNLIAFHGVVPQERPFPDILKDVHDFLTSPAGRSETIVMSIKQEDFTKTSGFYFSAMVRRIIMSQPGGWDESAASRSSVNNGMWFLENRIPSLGEVRGKVVLLSRFGEDGSGWPQGLEGLGIHPTTWPDSPETPFEWDLKGTTMRTADWYNIGNPANIPRKVNVGAANLLLPRNPSPPRPILPITYFSAASFPLALPPTVAKGVPGIVEGVNTLLGKWLLQQIGEAGKDATQEPRIRGWPMLDYYSEPSQANVVPLLVECNFLGRTGGEEGW